MVALGLLAAACATQEVKEEPQAALPTEAVETTDKPIITLDKEYQTALVYMQSGRDQAAIEALTSISERYPLYAGPQGNLALIYQRQGRIEEAEQAFKKALQLNPKNARILNRFGIFYREQGRFKDAEAQYRRAISIAPDFLDPYRNMGILYDIYYHNPSEALGYYRHYQTMLETEDSQVKLWIVELERKVGVKTRIAGKPPVTAPQPVQAAHGEQAQQDETTVAVQSVENP